MKFTPWQRLRSQLFLTGIGMVRRMTLGTRVAMIRNGEVYLIRHTYVPGFQFPGGGVEPGETAEVAAAREVLEETGLRPIGPMDLFGLYHNTSIVTNRDHVALYVCRAVEPVYEFKANREIAEFGWFPLDGLPDQTTPATRLRLEEIERGTPKSAIWGY